MSPNISINLAYVILFYTMIPSEIYPSQIITFLNSPYVISCILLLTVIICGITLIALLYHWTKYNRYSAVKLLPDEQIIKVFRKHWFIFLLDVLLVILAALIPFAVYFLPKEWTQLIKSITPFLSTLYLAWSVILFFGILVMATTYFFDIWVLTNKRLIDVDQINLFKRDISEIRLEHIVDLNIKIFGIINTFLKIGTVEVESSGAVKEFSLRNIADPEQARADISIAAGKKLDEAKEVKIVAGI